MGRETMENAVLVIPCSGIGKVHGLMSREATYPVTDELAPRLTETMCLALLVRETPKRSGGAKPRLHHD